MTAQTPYLNLIETVVGAVDTATDAVELEGLALAMRIVVSDYLSDRQLEKANALDALACALHGKAKSHSVTAGQPEGKAHV
jgi:hypothetical protein